MKRWIAASAAAIILAACTAVTTIDKTFAAAQLTLTVDGEAALSPLHPFQKDGLVYVPVRVLTEFYPARLQWDNKLKLLTIPDDSSSTIIKPGSELILYYGNTSALEGKAILLKGHNYIPASSLNLLSGADFRLDQGKNTVSIISGSVSTTVRKPAEALAAAEDHPKVKIYAALKDQTTYKGYILEVNGKKHQFDWETPRDPNHPPELYYADVNKDGQPETVVILTLGTGTGIVEQEIHIVKPETWKELTVPEAWKAASQLVSSSMTADHNDMVISLKLKGTSPAEVTLRLPDRAEDWNIGGKAGIGTVTYYSVESGRLVAELNVTTGFLESVGGLKLVYKPSDSGMAMEPESVTFLPVREYPATIKESGAND
ncbi:copper amine oxidase N-terminal domain-containing protein [Paenibacillus ihuae]|uniref:copper amine oxidase N-terminal domain-containing protein n=1 Tax=Paenibacillus ihuae TaxID=1232431 RepID=UPI0006D5B6C7|nr:copper amine oxidase N-terminal domain-containing protein [Paenibacillus ihuae]